MPIYEYECDSCANQFERLRLPSQAAAAEPLACPSCGGTSLRQMPSLFAVDSEGTRRMNKEHGRRMAKRDLTDQRRAEIEHITEHHREHES